MTIEMIISLVLFFSALAFFVGYRIGYLDAKQKYDHWGDEG